MSRKQISIYLDDEVLTRINADKGNLNKRITELINTGLSFENSNPTDIFIQLLKIAKKLNEDRKSGLITFNKSAQETLELY